MISSDIDSKGRRRKVKCNYPRSTDPGSEHTQSEQSDTLDLAASIASTTKCIECTTHGRVCEIQGIVKTSNNGEKGDEKPSKLPERIYKRRRYHTGTQSDPPESDSEELANQDHLAPRPRLFKIHVNRMNSVAERLAKRSRSAAGPSEDSGVLAMHDSERIGAYEYLTAMNGELYSYGAPEKIDQGAEHSVSSTKSSQRRGPLQSAFEQEMGLKTSSPVLSQVFNNSMVC